MGDFHLLVGLVSLPPRLARSRLGCGQLLLERDFSLGRLGEVSLEALDLRVGATKVGRELIEAALEEDDLLQRAFE
ncbi:MAG: hypothetical protein QM765_43640 [Myxococcales bacterium]